MLLNAQIMAKAFGHYSGNNKILSEGVSLEAPFLVEACHPTTNPKEAHRSLRVLSHTELLKLPVPPGLSNLPYISAICAFSSYLNKKSSFNKV